MAMAANQWTRHEDKLFEKALVLFPEDSPDRWERIAERLQKSPAEVREHYDALVHDVLEIDSGRVDLPDYLDDSPAAGWDSPNQISFGTKHTDNERKKGTPWTEEEHRLFLLGLEKYGKGDWRSISRNVVISRTPTQVASHAQKYFLRQSSGGKKERKRSSIHDITTPESKTLATAGLDQNWVNANPIQPELQPQMTMAEFNSPLPPSDQFAGQGQAHSLGHPVNFGFPM